ncbi:MAG: divalent-cation tolerance protein CutA [Spirochaetes bacterium]|jgi:periplasmic divalent cation tolerance protein|nr:divalent-cation tolerance protein CutA [Spirochaetota bacterium]
MEKHIVVCCTTPSREVAVSIAESLIPGRLAACVNIVGGIHSMYTWKGELCREEECLMIIKTRGELFERLRERIASLHPYEVPEIIAMPIVTGHAPYLEWIDESTG